MSIPSSWAAWMQQTTLWHTAFASVSFAIAVAALVGKLAAAGVLSRADVAAVIELVNYNVPAT